MLKFLSKIIWILVVLTIVFLAAIENYTEEMKQLEAKIWISVVEPVQEFISEMKWELDEKIEQEPQRSIEDIVNNEITP